VGARNPQYWDYDCVDYVSLTLGSSWIIPEVMAISGDPDTPPKFNIAPEK